MPLFLWRAGEQATQKVFFFLFLFGIGTEMIGMAAWIWDMDGRMEMVSARYGTGVGTAWNDWLGGLVISILYSEDAVCVVV